MSNVVKYENRSGYTFPENTILKEKLYGPGTTKFYVHDGRTLVETRSYPSVNNRTAEYRITSQLRDKYPDFDVRSNTWNPIRHRVYGENYTTVNLPAKFVEA
jgi:hypothetical protein